MDILKKFYYKFFNILITFFIKIINVFLCFYPLSNYRVYHEFFVIKLASLFKIFVFNSNKFYYLFIILPKTLFIILIILNIFPIFRTTLLHILTIFFILIFSLTKLYIFDLRILNKNLISKLSKKVDTITTNYAPGIHPCEWPENIDPDDEDADDISEEMCLPLNIFINYYVRKYVEDNIEIKYNSIGFDFKYFRKKYNIPKSVKIFHDEKYNIIYVTEEENNEKQLKIILYLSKFLAYYEKSCNNFSKDLELLIFFFISSVLFSIYIFFRFIRPRLPKDIPISLTDFYFFILLIICISYLYIIYRLMKPKMPSLFVLNIIQKIIYPFSYIRNKIIYHPTFYPYYNKFLLKNVLIKFLKKSPKEYFYIIFIYKFLPRIALIIILILDVCVFQKIQIFYYFLVLNIISTLFSTLIYNLKTGEEYLVQLLEQRYEKVYIWERFNNIPKELWDHKIKLYGNDKFELLTFEEKYEFLTFHENNLPKYLDSVYKIEFIGGIISHNPHAIYHSGVFSVRDSLNIIYDHRLTVDYNDPFHYIYDDYPEVFFPILEEYKKKHNKLILFYEDYCILRKQYYDYAEVIYNIRKFNTKYDSVEKDYKILPLTIGIYIMTFICWAFILGVSLYVFPPTFEYTLIFLNNMLENLMNEDPFSLCRMYEETPIQISDKPHEP